MYIEKYNFGNITIDGKKYTNDILIYPNGVVQENWWRLTGHELNIRDLPDLSNHKSDIFIMGTGSEGLLRILPETREFFKKHNIKLYADKTAEAVKLFNKLHKENKKVMAGFHITC